MKEIIYMLMIVAGLGAMAAVFTVFIIELFLPIC